LAAWLSALIADHYAAGRLWTAELSRGEQQVLGRKSACKRVKIVPQL
jgi:hypothetical protein